MSMHLKPHRSSLVLLLIITLSITAAIWFTGTPKPVAALHRNDLFAEGASAALVLCWYLLVLAARPRGRVTTLLGVGLGSLFVGMWTDALDELVTLPATTGWTDWLEPSASLLGLLTITAGIYLWHREQLALNHLLRTRESGVRDHFQLDGLVPMHRAAYFREQAVDLVAQQRRAGAPCALIAVDMVGFHAINARHGFDEGDRVLNRVGQLLALNLRPTDLVCRDAGDRFSMLLPATDQAMGEALAAELREAIEATPGYTAAGERLSLQVRTAVHMVPAGNDSASIVNAIAAMHRRSAATIRP